jgi:tetratricopeptide (TPR) repeat protein
MNPDTNANFAAGISADGRRKLEKSSFYVLLVTIILSLLAIWPSKFIAPELVKTIVIVLGTMASVALLGINAAKERRMVLPSKSLVTLGILMAVSLVISALQSVNVYKSFAGQGFEIGTVGFILSLFVAALAALALIYRKNDRVLIIYATIVISFLIMFVVHALRLIIGPDFLSLGVLSATTSTVIGSWGSLGIFAGFVALISAAALMTLPSSGKMKFFYWLLALLSLITVAFTGNSLNPTIWFGLGLVALGLCIFTTASRVRSQSGMIAKYLRNIAWIPAILFIISLVFWLFSDKLTAPIAQKTNTYGSEIVLPWQMSVDVISGAVKDSPLFGVGPNNFSRAYLNYKPASVNTTDAWGLEFNNGFALIPSMTATQGVVGTVLWILLLVFIGIGGAKVMKRLPEDPSHRFMLVSSFGGTVFFWIMLLLSVPSHTIAFLAFVVTGMFFGVAMSLELVSYPKILPIQGSKGYKFMPAVMAVLVLVVAVWGIIYVKKTIGLAYFGAGVKQLTVANDPDRADAYFAKSLSVDPSDIYWQARVEAALAKSAKMIGTIKSDMPASTSQALSARIVESMNLAATYATKAIAYDPSYYYNYLSQARVFEFADNFRVPSSYENAVKAYTEAIRRNPMNPSLYLNLAKLQAKDNKLDEALQTIGAAMNVKNNYLDLVFLLSQVNAAKGNLPQATAAAQYAIELNPQNPTLYFQLGLLQYNQRNFTASAEALANAVKLQPDYANAQYFLGLSLARLGKTNEATTQFANLAKSNPDNQEVGLILTRLQSGKPLFSDMQSAPEKRSTLPIKTKK